MAKKRSAISEYLAEIGKRGGQVTGHKGLAAMSPEQRKAIAKKGLETRRAKARAKAGKKKG